MPNFVNEAIKSEVEALLVEGADALFVQPVGLAVGDSNAFRAALAERRLRLRVIKNSLARQVLEARGFTGLDALFAGPSAVIVPQKGESVDAAAIVASKVVAEWRKRSGGELPAVKGGLLDGALLDGAQAEGLKRLPGREELLSTLVGQILGPGRRLAAQIKGPGGRIAGALKARVDDLEKAG